MPDSCSPSVLQLIPSLKCLITSIPANSFACVSPAIWCNISKWNRYPEHCPLLKMHIVSKNAHVLECSRMHILVGELEEDF